MTAGRPNILRFRAAALAVGATLWSLHQFALLAGAADLLELESSTWVLCLPLISITWALALSWFSFQPDARGGRALWLASHATGLIVLARALFTYDDGLWYVTSVEGFSEMTVLAGLAKAVVFGFGRSFEAMARGVAFALWVQLLVSATILLACGLGRAGTRHALRRTFLVAAACGWAAAALTWVEYVSRFDTMQAAVLVLGPRRLLLELWFAGVGLRLLAALRTWKMAVRLRPPWVLFLRPFDRDALREPEVASFAQRVVGFLFFGGMIPSQVIGRLRGRYGRNFEDVIAPSVRKRLGGMVALGEPGEWIPTLGATRLYASDTDWRDELARLVAGARCVLILPGLSDGLEVELRHLAREVEAGRLDPTTVFVVTPVILAGVGEGMQHRWWLIVELFAKSGWTLPERFPGYSTAVGFASMGQPRMVANHAPTAEALVDAIEADLAAQKL